MFHKILPRKFYNLTQKLLYIVNGEPNDLPVHNKEHVAGASRPRYSKIYKLAIKRANYCRLDNNCLHQ
jgi:hypothetical protein